MRRYPAECACPNSLDSWLYSIARLSLEAVRESNRLWQLVTFDLNLLGQFLTIG